jgi:hypothetical protein
MMQMEEEDGEEEEMEEEAAAPEPVKPHRPKIDDMYSEFINMAHKFTSMVEDTRKQEFMSRNTACQSLDFDSPPPKPDKYRYQQFTPPRHAHERIRARQHDDDDCEHSSLCSFQTGSTRIRLQERWRNIGTKDKATCNSLNIKQWIEDHAHAEMAKAGQFKDLRPALTDVGGFKRAHVSNCRMFNFDNFGELIWFVSLQEQSANILTLEKIIPSSTRRPIVFWRHRPSQSHTNSKI